jgi:hypothetical protein
MDPVPDLGGPKTCGSGSPSLVEPFLTSFFHILSAVKREPVNDTGLCNTEAGKIFFTVIRYQVSLWVLVQSLFFRAFLIPIFCHRIIKRNTVGVQRKIKTDF